MKYDDKVDYFRVIEAENATKALKKACAMYPKIVTHVTFRYRGSGKLDGYAVHVNMAKLKKQKMLAWTTSRPIAAQLYKVYDGKKYKYYGSSVTPEVTQTHAKQLQKRGYHIRIHRVTGNRPKDVYGVWSQSICLYARKN